MTSEQKDALCEYIDGQREAGRRYDEIAESLKGKLAEKELDSLEQWHRQWQKKQWREEMKRLHTFVPVGDGGGEEGALDAGAAEWVNSAGEGEMEMVRYLAERLVGKDTRSLGVPRWRPVKPHSEWSASGGGNGTRPFFTLFLRHEIPERRHWKWLYTRSLTDGQTCEYVKGPGQAGGVKWVYSAVVFKTGGRVDHVEPEARIRRRVYPGSHRSHDLGLLREAVQLEKLHLVREKLDHEEIGARLAALLQTYLGKASGIKSGAHLGRLTNRTRQAVSARKLLIAEDYYEATGGRSGFEGVNSAARHRAKVTAKKAPTDGKSPL